jgi:hypothetical protein
LKCLCLFLWRKVIKWKLIRVLANTANAFKAATPQQKACLQAFLIFPNHQGDFYGWNA